MVSAITQDLTAPTAAPRDGVDVVKHGAPEKKPQEPTTSILILGQQAPRDAQLLAGLIKKHSSTYTWRATEAPPGLTGQIRGLDQVATSNFPPRVILDRSIQWARAVTDALDIEGEAAPDYLRAFLTKRLFQSFSYKITPQWLALEKTLSSLSDSKPSATLTFIGCDPLEEAILTELANKHSVTPGLNTQALDHHTQHSPEAHHNDISVPALRDLVPNLVTAARTWLALEKRVPLTIDGEAPRERTILHFTHSNIHAKIIERTRALLASRGWTNLLITADEPLSTVPEKDQLPLTAFQDRRWAWSVFNHGRRLRATLHHQRLPAPLARAGATLAKRLQKELKRWTSMRALYESALRRAPSSCALTLDEEASSCALAAAAKARSVPTIDVAHALPGWSGHGVPVTDVYAGFGQSSIELLQQSDARFEGCKLIPVGPCRLDDIPLGDFPAAADTRESLNLKDHTGPVILFTSQWVPRQLANGPQHKRDALRWLCKALPSESVLILKKHPLETDDICKEITKELLEEGRFRVVDDSADLYGLMEISDALVTMWSNTGLEAVSFGLPVVAIDSAGWSELMPYTEGDVGLRCQNEDELRAALNGAFMSERDEASRKQAQAEFLHRHLQGNDGKASARLADLIESITRDNDSHTEIAATS